MRVRIIRRPPPSYGNDRDSFHVGAVYNLDSALASALLADGCAELFDTLTDEEKKRSSGGGLVWNAPDRDRRRRRALPDFSEW